MDIDGTIATADTAHAHPGVHAMIDTLKEHNSVFLFSNAFLAKRNLAMAEKLGVPYVKSHSRKPDPHIIRAIPNPEHRPVVVIGDLFVTDGLLAYFSGAKYVRVRRFVPPGETTWWHFVLYHFDDTMYKLVGRFFTR